MYARRFALSAREGELTMIMRTVSLLALMGITVAGFGCDKKTGGDTADAASAASTAAGGAAAAGSKRKLKTTITAKQIEDTYASTIKGNNDFKKHGDLVMAKLGKPAKVDGDKSTWYGYKPAEGAMGDDCMELYTSATKGSGEGNTSGDGNCWDK
jgi:hypothetical protein